MIITSKTHIDEILVCVFDLSDELSREYVILFSTSVVHALESGNKEQGKERITSSSANEYEHNDARAYRRMNNRNSFLSDPPCHSQLGVGSGAEGRGGKTRLK